MILYTIFAFIFLIIDAKLIVADRPKFNEDDFPLRLEPPDQSSLILECKVENADKIFWLKDDILLGKESRTLSLSSVSKQDSGIYRCVASNSVATVVSPSTIIAVQYFDDFDHTSTVYSISSSLGGSFVIRRPELLASFSEDLTFSWFKDGSQVHTNGSHYITADGHLVISEAEREVFGKYRVMASSSMGEAYSQEYTVAESFLKGSPKFEIIFTTEDRSVAIKKSPTEDPFDCVTSFGSNAITHWFLNGKSISSRPGFKTSLSNRRISLTNPSAFKYLDPGDHQLLCKVSAESGRLFEQKAIKLTILSSPVISPLPEIFQKPLGSSFNADCTTVDHKIPHTGAWYKSGKKVNSLNGILSIPTVTSDDYGVYQCEVANEAGRQIETVTLQEGNEEGFIPPVSFARDAKLSRSIEGSSTIPIFSISPESATIPAGSESHQLNCKADGNPSPSILWKFEDEVIPIGSSKYEQTSDGLTIHEPKRTDSGKYTCVARGPQGSDSVSADITVTGGSLIDRGPTNQSILIGNTLEIPCEVNPDYRSQAQIMWSLNGDPIPPSGNPGLRLSRNRKGSLQIGQVGPDSIGEYTCTVTVGDKEESVSMWLEIIEKPNMPTGVVASLVNDTAPAKIKVAWSEGFDGNSQIIRYTIQMRTLGPTELWSDWETVGETDPAENCCSYLLDNLRPSVTAEFRVIASNKHGPGKPSLSSPNITMPQQPPAAAPKNVAASARSSNSIMVQWQKPQMEQFIGDILGYVIRYRLAGYTLPWIERNVTDKDARNAVIDQLITWQEYEIQMAAYNDRGLGVFSKSIEVTTAEGVPTQAPRQVKVEVLNSTAVDVTFTAPDQQRIPGVNLGYKIQFWKGAAEQGKLYKQVLVDPSSKNLRVTIEGLEKFGHYNCTVLCYTAPGDGPRSLSIPIVTAQDIPGTVSSLTIQEVMYDGAFVTWDAPTQPNGIITRYVLRYWGDATPESKSTMELDGHQRNATISGLSSTTKYSLDILASTMMGDGPREETKFESGRPPVLPERATTLSVSDVQARSVNLQFIPGHDGYTAIRMWIVEAKVEDSGVFQALFNISSPKARSFTVTGLRPYTKYQLRLIAENVKGKGAPSEPTRIFETKPTNPETPSTALFAEPVSATSISLSWTPLLATQWNGQPRGYLVLYREDGTEDWNEVRTSSLRSGDFILRDLMPFTAYEVDLFAENMFARSASAGMTKTKTYESTPSGAPKNVRAESEGIKSIVVRWEPLAEDVKNGDILGYTVRVVPEGEWIQAEETKILDISGEDVLVAKVTGLQAFTTYHVFVSAYTIVGNGPENSVPTLAETQEDIPGIPSKVSFSLVSEDEVRLKWFPPENTNGKIKGYTITYWLTDEGPTAAHRVPIPSDSLGGFTAADLKPNSKYTFAISAETSVGVGREAEVQVFTTSVRVPVANPPVPSRDERSKFSSNQISIRWDLASHLEDEEAPVRLVQVEYQKANDENWTTLDRSIAGDKGGVTITRLSPNSVYRFRIRFVSDFAQSLWSPESEWMRTLPSSPELPPFSISASPYDSSSILLQWQSPNNSWNADNVGYRVYYREYPSNDSWHSEEISVTGDHNEKEQFVLSRLTSFRHYIVRMTSFNSEGDSPYSVPAFVYVGYSIPKRNITNLIAEPVTSSSLEVRWDPWKEDENDVISGFKVRFVPILSVLSEISHEEEIMVVENNSCLITDLRKYTKYQISVTAYNRAGESNPSQLRIRTLEDVPGPVSNLRFSDILLDSVRVIWDPPSQPNGIITNYTVNYKTFKMQKGFMRESQSQTSQLFYPASELEEGGHYVFTVWAETSAGRGTETVANVTIGSNPEPGPTSRPSVIPGQSSVSLSWRDPDYPDIIGHLIQAKRVSNDTIIERGPISSRIRRSYDFRPSHVLGKWVTLKTLEGYSMKHEISYRELEPSSSYVFRVFARNSRGVGQPSEESEILVVPASIPEEPFYTTWWFIAIVAMSTFVIIVVVVAFLCVTGSRAKFKRDKRNSVDSLQLADGNFVTFPMKSNQRMGRGRNEVLTRPGTTQSWLSDRDPPAYGSVLAVNRDPTTGGSVVNMYGLATDVIPPAPSQQALQRLSALVGRDVRTPGSAYVSGPIRNGSDEGNYERRSIYGNRSEYAYASRGDYGSTRPSHNNYDDSFDDEEEESVDGDVAPPETNDIASHYGNTDNFRETWRRVRDTEGVPTVIPSASASIVAESPAGSSETSSNWPNQQAPALANGFSSFV